MRSLAARFLLLLSTFILSLPAIGAAPLRPVQGGVPNEYIVLLNDVVQNVDDVAATLAARNGGRVVTTWKAVLKGFWLRATPDGAQAMASEPLVRLVEQNTFLQSAGPADPVGAVRFGFESNGDPSIPWNLQRISVRQRSDMAAMQVYRPMTSGQDVVIYVVDSGVLRFHQEWWRTSAPPADLTDPASYERVENVPGSNLMTNGSIHDPDANLDLTGLPSDPFASDSPYIGTDAAHPCAASGRDPSHPWFSDSEGFVSHGSACGSVAAGRAIGVAPGATVIPVKVNGCAALLGDATSTAYLIAAFDWIVGNELSWSTVNGRRGAVVSISTWTAVTRCSGPLYNNVCQPADFGIVESPFILSAMEEAIGRAVAHGIPVVASANNNILDACTETPARLSYHGGFGANHVITVGGIADNADERWTGGPERNRGSNYGNCIDVWAPAKNIPTEYTSAVDAYRTANATGTSFSAPIVAGMLARMMSDMKTKFVSATNGVNVTELVKTLKASASHLDRDGANILDTSPDLLAYLGAFTVDVQPTDQVLGQNGATLTAGVTGAADLTCTWYEGTPGNTGTQVGTGCSICFGATGCLGAPSQTTAYWARLTRNGLTADTVAAKVIVGACGVISLQPQSSWVPAGQKATLSVAMLGGGPWNYQWYSATKTKSTLTTTDLHLAFDPIPNATTSSFDTFDTETKAFQVKVTLQSDPSCSRTSDAVEVRRTVTPVFRDGGIPKISGVPFGDVPVGTQPTITVDADTPTGEQARYQWFEGAANDTRVPLHTGKTFETGHSVTLAAFAPGATARTLWARAYTTTNDAASSRAITVTPCNVAQLGVLTDLIVANHGMTSIALTGMPSSGWQWRQLVGTDWTVIQRQGEVLLPIATTTPTQYATEALGPGCSVANVTTIIAQQECEHILIKRADDQFRFSGDPITLNAQYAQGSETTRTVFWYQGLFPDSRVGGLGLWPDQLGGNPSFPAERTMYVWPRIRSLCTNGQNALEYAMPTLIVVSPCTGYFDLYLASNGRTFSEPFTLEAPQVPIPPPPASSPYRWYQRIGSAAPTPITQGVDGNKLHVPGVQQATSFYVEVDHACNGSATTSTSYYFTADLCSPRQRAALPPPAAPPNTGQVLSVEDDHDGTTFDWFAGHDYNDVSHPAGSGATILIYPQATSYYWVRMSKTCGGQTPSTNSDFVLVEVTCPLHIATQPSPVTVQIPQDALNHPVTLSTSVEATGTEVTYEWYVNGAKSAQTDKTYTWTYAFTNPVPALIQQRVYAVIKDSCGGSLQSQEVLLTIVNNPQRIYAFGGGGVLGSAGQGVELYVLMDPPAETQSYTYDWYRVGAPGTSDVLLGSHSSRIWVTTSHQDAFYVRVTGHYTLNGAPYDVQSLSGETYVWVNGVCDLPPLLVNQPKTDLGEYDTSGVTFVARSDWPNVHYQWYRGMSGDTRDPVSSDAGAPDKLTVGFVGEVPHPYWVRAYLPCGAHRDSTTLTFTKGSCAPVLIAGNPASVEVPYDGSTRLYVVADPFKNYSWFRRDDTSQPLNQYSSSLPLDHLQISGRYWARVSNTNCGGSTDSLVATVRVASCPGLDVTFPDSDHWALRNTATDLIVTPPAGQSPAYQWYAGEVGDDRNPVTSGGTSAVLPIDHVSSDLKYWVHVSGNGCAVDSPTVNVHPCDEAWVNKGTLPTEFDIAPGQYQWIGASTGGTNLTYQWYEGDVGDISRPIGDGFHDIQVNPTVSTRYWVRATSHCGANTHDADSQQFLIVICPVITTQPYARDEYVMPGGTTVVSAGASGTKLAYQWYKGDISHPAGTGASITTDPITADTTYFVVVTSDSGCPQYSEPVIVHVCAGEAHWVAPYGGAVKLNQVVRASINTTPSYIDGAELYWYKGVPGNVDQSTLVAPPNYPTLDLYPAPPSSTYWVRVQKGACHADSPGITFEVCIPEINHQPDNAMLLNAQTPVDLTVGTTLGTIQWYAGNKGDISNPVPNGTTTTIHVAPANDTRYWARATGSCGISADSESALVTVCRPPSITGQPPERFTTQGQTAGLPVYATGTDLHYQWYYGASGNTTQPINSTSARTANLSIALNDTTSVWVRISGPAGGNCGTADSNSATIHVCATPVITTQPQSLSIFSGTGTRLTVAAAESTSELLHYQWYRGAAADRTHPVGGDNAWLDTGNLTQETGYFVDVTAAGGVCLATSDVATVSMCAFPQSISAPPDAYIAIGQTNRLYTVMNAASYVWYQGTSGDRSHPLTGPITWNYYDASPTVTTQYWCEVTSGSCISQTGTATINVCIPTITTQPAPSQMITAGNEPDIKVVADTAGLTYQWYIGNSGVTTTPVTGQTGATLHVTPTQATTYWVRVTGSCGRSVDSNAAAVTICQPAHVGGVSSNYTIPRGQSVVNYVYADGSPTLTYQWYIGNSGIITQPWNGATQSSLQVSPQSTTNYWARVKNSCNTAGADSAAITISVCVPPTISTQPQSQYIYSGDYADLSVTASADSTIALSYQWYQGAAGDFSHPVGTGLRTFRTPNLTVATQYWVRVRCSTVCEPVDSDVATVSICPYPQVINAPADVNATTTATTRLTSVAQTGSNIYYWYQGANTDTSHSLGVTSVNYKDVAPTSTTQYWAQVTNGTCVSKTRTITVNVCVPTFTLQPHDTSFAPGNSAHLTASADTSGVTYQWYTGSKGVTTSPVNGQTQSSIDVAPSQATSYWVRATGTCGVWTDSDAAIATPCVTTAITQQPYSQAGNRGYYQTFAVYAVGSNLRYQWYLGDNTDSSHPIVNATNYNYTMLVYDSQKLWVQVTGTCGTVNSNTVWASIYPQIGSQPQSTIVGYNSTTQLSVGASGIDLHYVWRWGNGQQLQGSGDSPNVITPSVLSDTTVYCDVTSGIAVTRSYEADLTVCSGPPIYSFTKSGTGSCRTLTVSTSSQAGGFQWYQGPRGDTSHPVSGYWNQITVCPASSTTYWCRVLGFDNSMQTDCYSDTDLITVP